MRLLMTNWGRVRTDHPHTPTTICPDYGRDTIAIQQASAEGGGVLYVN